MDADSTLTVDPATLPDEPVVLKQLVMQLFDELQKAKAALQRQEHHMHLLLRRLYGSTSEKFDPQQALLFDPRPEGDGSAENKAVPPAATESTTPRTANRDRHGRGRIPEKFQREEVVHDLADAEKEALGGVENLVELPPEQSEQYDWRPSTLHVLVHTRKKYARREQLPESGLTPAEQNVVVAPKPAEAIPGALAAPGLMAQVIVSKGADHLPLHRLEGIFKRQGARISRQTMDGWWLQTAEFLQPLYAAAVRVVLGSYVVHTDDTSVKVRDAWRKQKHTGRFWPYVGDPLHPLTVFDYTTNHTRDGPAAFLKDYRGYMQADAFNGYDGIYLESQGRIIEVACWAHAAGSTTSIDDLTRREWKPPWRGSGSFTRSRRICVSGGRPSGTSCRSSSKRHTLRPSVNPDRCRCWKGSTRGWRRRHPRSCPRATSEARWITR